MKDFINYYQEELLFLRKNGGEFAKKHPEIASNIDIKNGASSDPHTERIIESVAFLSANLSQKIDDNSQSVAFYLLSALYPNLISTFPPCSVACFQKPKKITVNEVVQIPKNTTLTLKSSSGISCIFKTLYALNIYPIAIHDIALSKTKVNTTDTSSWAINIALTSQDVFFDEMNISDLLFGINSEIIEDALLIYEAIFSMKNSVLLKINDSYIKLDPQNFIQCGFQDEDAICPVTKYANNSFQLFQEMIHFKKKFMFFKILNIDKLLKNSNCTNVKDLTIVIFVNFLNERLLEVVRGNCIMLNATPIVNLFSLKTDPFRFDGTQNKYRLTPDQSKNSSIEIQSISNIHMIDSNSHEDSIVSPYFVLSSNSHKGSVDELFWTCSKESAKTRGVNGFDTYISFVDPKMNATVPYDNVAYAETLCINRFEPRDIPTLSTLDISGLQTNGYVAQMLYNTTPAVSCTSGKSTLWNLIAQLASTNISISTNDAIFESAAKLTEIFSCGFYVKSEELLSTISCITSEKIVRRFGNDAWRGFVQGYQFKIFVNNDKTSFFNFFFSCILNQYLSSCVSINSFIEILMISEKSKKTIAHLPATSGRMELI